MSVSAPAAFPTFGSLAGYIATGERPQARRVSWVSGDPDSDRLLDGDLFTLVAQGDRDAFAALYERFSRPLFSVATRILGNRADAEDVVHDVFISVWRKAATFDSMKGSGFSWMVTMIRNRAIDRLRARTRRSELLAVCALELAPREDTGVGDTDRARAVKEALATLPPKQRRAMELAFFSGLTRPEIARLLQEPEGTVGARVSRGLQVLRKALVLREC